MLEDITTDIAENIAEWMAEGEQLARQDQDEEAYWYHVKSKIRARVQKAYKFGRQHSVRTSNENQERHNAADSRAASGS